MSSVPLACMGCRSTIDLYLSPCKHLTLCIECGKKQILCSICGVVVTRLIKEYDVRAGSNSDINYFIGKFDKSLPNFPKNSSEEQWTLQKEDLLGRQVTDSLEKHNWLLKNETSQYHGQPMGVESGYNLLIKEGNEYVSVPADSWYKFNKVAECEQLTLEEAKEKMKNMSRTSGWVIEQAAAFGDSNVEAGSSRQKSREDEDDIGDAWDHAEVFSDDDEAVGNNSDDSVHKQASSDEVQLRAEDCSPKRPAISTEEASSQAPISEAEIRAILLPGTQITTQDMLAMFRGRLRSSKEKEAFLSKLNRLANTPEGQNYLRLKET